MGKLEAPRVEATPEPPGSLASSPPDSSSLSSPSPGSQSPIATPPLFRVLALPGPAPVQPSGQEPLIERLPGYRRIVIPREPTLLEILKRSAGVSRDEDVLRLRAATLRVVAARVSLRRLESLTPRLRTLRLDGSALASLREIGTGLRHLKVLHVARCGLTSLDGVLGVARLEELHASANRIADVAPLAPLSRLHTLDLSDNPVEAGGLWLASLCGRLRHARLRGSAAAERADYRALVSRAIPRLLTLDGQPLRGDNERDAVEPTEQIVFPGHFNSDSEEDDILAFSDPPDEGDSTDSLGDLDKEDSADETKRLQPSMSRPSTAPAPGATQRTRRGGAPAHTTRPQSARPALANDMPVSLAELRTVPSRLTSGLPLCGSLARALRLAPESRPAARRLAAASNVLSTSPPARPEANTPSAPLELGLAGAGAGGGDGRAPHEPDSCVAARRWRQRWAAFRESSRLLDETYSEAGPSGFYTMPAENREGIGEQEEMESLF